MKRLIIALVIIASCCVITPVLAQFKNPKNAWALSLGGSHGTNATADQWDIQYRGYFQYEIIPSRLIGQLGLGLVGLYAPGSYSASMGILDARALYTPFSLPNLNPYVYGGVGMAKVLENVHGLLPVVPLGAGLQTRIANGVLMDINTGYTVIFSDKVDGQSRTNKNLNPLSSGRHDGFYGITLGVSLSLGGEDEQADTKKQELEAAEARRVRELAAAEAVRVKENADAEAKLTKQLADAEALRVKQQAESEAAAKVANAAYDADIRLAASQKGRDTVISFVKGKTIVLRGINFEFNKAALTPESETFLLRAYTALVVNPTVQIVITGHTDNIGTQESNQKLSLERAQAVRNWLVDRGISSSRLRTVGRGQNEPVAQNDTEEGRAQNRRMEFFVAQ